MRSQDNSPNWKSVWRLNILPAKMTNIFSIAVNSTPSLGTTWSFPQHKGSSLFLIKTPSLVGLPAAHCPSLTRSLRGLSTVMVPSLSPSLPALYHFLPPIPLKVPLKSPFICQSAFLSFSARMQTLGESLPPLVTCLDSC